MYVDREKAVVSNLMIEDPDFVELVREAEDPVRAALDVTSIGARVIRMTQTTVDAALVETRFGALEQRIGEGLTEGC